MTFVLCVIYSECPDRSGHSEYMIRLSISEAAKIFGISEKTIRRAIKNHEISYMVVQSKYRITFEGLIRWSQEKPRIKNRLNKNGIGQFVDKWKTMG